VGFVIGPIPRPLEPAESRTVWKAPAEAEGFTETSFKRLGLTPEQLEGADIDDILSKISDEDWEALMAFEKLLDLCLDVSRSGDIVAAPYLSLNDRLQDIYGIFRCSTEKEWKKTYRRYTQLLHPDKGELKSARAKELLVLVDTMNKVVHTAEAAIYLPGIWDERRRELVRIFRLSDDEVGAYEATMTNLLESPFMSRLGIIRIFIGPLGEESPLPVFLTRNMGDPQYDTGFLEIFPHFTERHADDPFYGNLGATPIEIISRDTLFAVASFMASLVDRDSYFREDLLKRIGHYAKEEPELVETIDELTQLFEDLFQEYAGIKKAGAVENRTPLLSIAQEFLDPQSFSIESRPIRIGQTRLDRGGFFTSVGYLFFERSMGINRLRNYLIDQNLEFEIPVEFRAKLIGAIDKAYKAFVE
jgi:hypothetical protein